QAAQRVIGAELDNDGIHLLPERPGQPVAAGGTGVARHPAIDHTNVMALLIESRFQPLRKRLAGRYAVSSRQAVTESEDYHGLRRLGRWRKEQQHYKGGEPADHAIEARQRRPARQVQRWTRPAFAT